MPYKFIDTLQDAVRNNRHLFAWTALKYIKGMERLNDTRPEDVGKISQKGMARQIFLMRNDHSDEAVSKIADIDEKWEKRESYPQYPLQGYINEKFNYSKKYLPELPEGLAEEIGRVVGVDYRLLFEGRISKRLKLKHLPEDFEAWVGSLTGEDSRREITREIGEWSKTRSVPSQVTNMALSDLRLLKDEPVYELIQSRNRYLMEFNYVFVPGVSDFPEMISLIKSRYGIDKLERVG